MDDPNFVSVYTVVGRLSAEIIRLMLESFGIQATLYQESVGATYGLTVAPVGEVQIVVPVSQEIEALELLHAMEKGELELPHSIEDLNQPKEPGLKSEKP
jgi:hypothetical protein